VDSILRERSLNALDYLLDTVEWNVDHGLGKDVVELRNFLTGDQSTFYVENPFGDNIEVRRAGS
jgi:hypothetical protein